MYQVSFLTLTTSQNLRNEQSRAFEMSNSGTLLPTLTLSSFGNVCFNSKNQIKNLFLSILCIFLFRNFQTKIFGPVFQQLHCFHKFAFVHFLQGRKSITQQNKKHAAVSSKANEKTFSLWVTTLSQRSRSSNVAALAEQKRSELIKKLVNDSFK